MIRILTLFVGLVTGVQTVDLAVDGAVARVELRLGDRVVAVRTGPPWTARVDFGHEPSPGELVAVAFASDGREVGRDRAPVNLPTARAEVALLSERDADGRVVAAKVLWESPEFTNPRRIRAWVDGERVPIGDDQRIDLSAFEPGRPHVVDVEVVFGREVEVRTELVFGERFAGSHDSGLTAAPLIVIGGDSPPSTTELTGWLRHRGEPLRVAAVEQPEATVMVVPHPSVRTRLEEIDRELGDRRTRRRLRASGPVDDLGDALLYVLLPEPVVVSGVAGRRPSLLFPVNEEPMRGDDGLLEAALAPDRDTMIVSDLRLANAVATAGMRAARDNHRRAVLLLLGPTAQDHSAIAVAATRRFLRELRVPLVVWDLSGERIVQPGWGPADVVTDARSYVDALRALRHLLERQWIVWVTGRLLPQEIELSDAAEGVIPAMASLE